MHRYKLTKTHIHTWYICTYLETYTNRCMTHMHWCTQFFLPSFFSHPRNDWNLDSVCELVFFSCPLKFRRHWLDLNLSKNWSRHHFSFPFFPPAGTPHLLLTPQAPISIQNCCSLGFIVPSDHRPAGWLGSRAHKHLPLPLFYSSLDLENTTKFSFSQIWFLWKEGSIASVYRAELANRVVAGLPSPLKT